MLRFKFAQYLYMPVYLVEENCGKMCLATAYHWFYITYFKRLVFGLLIYKKFLLTQYLCLMLAIDD
jgi:hypothetical protein